MNAGVKRVVVCTVAILCSAVFVLLVNWLVSYGRLDVIIENNGDEPFYTYSLVSQSTGESIEKEGKSQEAFRLKKGSYDLRVETESGSFFAVISVGGWLRTTSLSGSLEEQYGREFIGGNTSGCIADIATTLISYQCGGPLSELRVQKPGTESSPPSTISSSIYDAIDTSDVADLTNSFIPHSVGGVFSIDGNSYMVLSIGSNAVVEPGHYLYLLSVSRDYAIQFRQVKILSTLDSSDGYTVVAHGSGYLAYSVNGSNVVVYDSIDSDGLEIGLRQAEDHSNLDFYNISVRGESFAALFSNSYGAGRRGGEKSIIVYGDANQRVSDELRQSYTSVNYCGEQLLCLFGTQSMDVYWVSGSGASLAYSVSAANKAYAGDDFILLQTASGIIKFYPQERKGSLIYNSTEYRVVSLGSLGDDAVVVVEDGSLSTYTLLLSREQSNDFIDKKLAEIKLSDRIHAATVFKNFVYISPSLPAPQYNAEEGLFINSPQQIEAGNAEAVRLFNSAGIGESYQLVVL